jgi:hypothetical protein
MRKHRRTANYWKSNFAYDLIEAFVRAWRHGTEPSQKRLALMGVKSLREFIKLMQAKAAFPLDLLTYGRTWCFDHIRPLSAFDFNEPKQLLAAVHHSNLRPVTILTNGRKGKRWICPEANPPLFPGL